MSDRLEAVKAQFDAMIERMKEEVCRQVDREMEVLLEMWREEKRRKMKKKPTCGRSIKRMHQDKAGGEDGGGQSDDEDYLNIEMKEELADEEDTTAPVPSTSGGQKRQATSVSQVAVKKRRMDSERQKSASGSVNFKLKIITIDCPVEACQCTFRCIHHMREHLLAVHKIQPFPCHAQGCGQQFDKSEELNHHTRTHPRVSTVWICPHCPLKTFPNSSSIGQHIIYHQTGKFQCAVDQCPFTSTTRRKVYVHQVSAHSVQHTCPTEGCTKVFKSKHRLIAHQLVHTSTTPFRCTYANCGHEAKQRGHIVAHIRTVHFKLPVTHKEQHRLGIIDDRNPNDFIEVDQEALQLERP